MTSSPFLGGASGVSPAQRLTQWYSHSLTVRFTKSWDCFARKETERSYLFVEWTFGHSEGPPCLPSGPPADKVCGSRFVPCAWVIFMRMLVGSKPACSAVDLRESARYAAWVVLIDIPSTRGHSTVPWFGHCARNSWVESQSLWSPPPKRADL
jgi:hypothetical protein